MIVDRVLEVFRDRQQRSRMSEASYWDERVRNRHGHARSVWHSQAFSEEWHQRQASLLEKTLTEVLGGVGDMDVLDIGCGTGRMTMELDAFGARVTGVDFSPEAIDAAREENERLACGCRFEVADIVHPPMPFADASFDAVVAVGCLAVACTTIRSLQDAYKEMARLVRPSGVVVLLEPIHASRLLGRVLKAPVQQWIDAAEDSGLKLADRSGMGFVPMRLALSSFDLPRWVVRPVFRAGEMVLDNAKALRLADYSLLAFRRADATV